MAHKLSTFVDVLDAFRTQLSWVNNIKPTKLKQQQIQPINEHRQSLAVAHAACLHLHHICYSQPSSVCCDAPMSDH
jgi:hypothetical protein